MCSVPLVSLTFVKIFIPHYTNTKLRLSKLITICYATFTVNMYYHFLFVFFSYDELRH